MALHLGRQINDTNLCVWLESVSRGRNYGFKKHNRNIPPVFCIVPIWQKVSGMSVSNDGGTVIRLEEVGVRQLGSKTSDGHHGNGRQAGLPYDAATAGALGGVFGDKSDHRAPVRRGGLLQNTD
jgi:hypothetical protein